MCLIIRCNYTMQQVHWLHLASDIYPSVPLTVIKQLVYMQTVNTECVCGGLTPASSEAALTPLTARLG